MCVCAYADPTPWISLALSSLSLIVASVAFIWAIKRPVWTARWESIGPGLYRFTIRNVGEGTARNVSLSVEGRTKTGRVGDGLPIEEDVLPGIRHEYLLGYGDQSPELYAHTGQPMMTIMEPATVTAVVTWHEAPFSGWGRKKSFKITPP